MEGSDEEKFHQLEAVTLLLGDGVDLPSARHFYPCVPEVHSRIDRSWAGGNTSSSLAHLPRATLRHRLERFWQRRMGRREAGRRFSGGRHATFPEICGLRAYNRPRSGLKSVA